MKNLKSVNLKKVGNYTKKAVKTFENNIIKEKDYIEKVHKNLKNLEN